MPVIGQQRRTPPDLTMPEHVEDEYDTPESALAKRLDTHERIRKRFGLIGDELMYMKQYAATSTTCACFRWVWTTAAAVDGQTDFTTPVGYEMQDNAYYIVFVRTSFEYLNYDYNIIPPNTLRLFAGIPAGEPVTIYAMYRDDIQDIHYEHCTVPALPYAFSPPVTVDRAPGRQLVFARHSPRFLDSGRPGDEYTVSNTLNTLSLTSGLGPVAEMAALFRLTECGVLWHEEILADTAGQTVIEPIYLGNILRPHDIGKLIVFARTSFRHPGIDYITNPAGNTLTLLRFPLGFGDPVNIWCFR